MPGVVEWARLTWPEAEAAVKAMPACLVPFGAVEAHGPHMNLQVDNVLATEACRRVCEETGIILMPTQPYGQVWSLYGFPGTLSISVQTLIALTKDLVRSLRDHGFKLVLIHSGHLGNVAGIKEAIRESYDEIPDVKAVHLDRLARAIEECSDQWTTPRSHPYYMHACEIETSMVLGTAPEEVHMDRAVRDYPDYPFDFDLTPSPWSVATKTGVLGDATAATAAKGARLLDVMVAAMVDVARKELDAVCK